MTTLSTWTHLHSVTILVCLSLRLKIFYSFTIRALISKTDYFLDVNRFGCYSTRLFLITDEQKGNDKQSECTNVQNKKSMKPRSHSNSRKNTTNAKPVGGMTSGNRNKNSSDIPPRLQSRMKMDGKSILDHRDLKNTDSLSTHVRGKYLWKMVISVSKDVVPLYRYNFGADVGPSIPALPPSGNAWDKPLTGTLRTGSPSTQRPSGSTVGVASSVIRQDKK